MLSESELPQERGTKPFLKGFGVGAGSMIALSEVYMAMAVWGHPSYEITNSFRLGMDSSLGLLGGIAGGYLVSRSFRERFSIVGSLAGSWIGVAALTAVQMSNLVDERIPTMAAIEAGGLVGGFVLNRVFRSQRADTNEQ